jgi:hypothetical protein
MSGPERASAYTGEAEHPDRPIMLRLTGIDIERCPNCQQGVLRPLEVLRPAPLVWDTS